MTTKNPNIHVLNTSSAMFKYNGIKYQPDMPHVIPWDDFTMLFADPAYVCTWLNPNANNVLGVKPA